MIFKRISKKTLYKQNSNNYFCLGKNKGLLACLFWETDKLGVFLEALGCYFHVPLTSHLPSTEDRGDWKRE